MTNNRKIALSATTFLVPFALASSVYAQSLPVGGTLAQGTATITSAGTTTTVNQTSSRAVINWTSFDVANGNTVNFTQPDANSATLNRVTGTTLSSIAGTINATGSVYLINPNGIQITSSGVVNVGRGFVASSLDIADSDFMQGQNLFSGTGGAVTANGSITAAAGGFVGLLGGEVAMGGTILAPAGTVTIGTTTQSTLSLSGGNFLQILLPTSAKLVGNGTVAALSTDEARNAVRHMVNLTPAQEANAVSGTNGDVTLSGTISTGGGNINVAALGDINLSGTLDASGSATGGSGVTLRSDSMGTGTGVVTAANGSIKTNASGIIDIYYNPTSYTAATDYSAARASGSGTLTAWMLVNDVNQLQNVGATGNYAQSRDIDASATASWNSGAGFRPIGTFSSFLGKFDGQSHFIKNLTINRPGTFGVGLFSISNGSTVIKNVGLVGGSITGGTYTGGIVGYNNSGTITNSFSTANITGDSFVGGLVGHNTGNGISNTYATGTVTGTGTVGGLAGENNGTVSNSYATGTVTGATAGGLVGSGTGTATNSFWNSTTTGQATSAGGGTALTSAQMMQMASFSPLDISAVGGQNTIWRIYEGSTTPLLRSFLKPVIVNGTAVYNGAAQGGSGNLTYANGTNVALISGALSPSQTLGTNVGTYNLPVDGLYSTQIGYDLIGGQFNITPRAITITADALSRIYGDANPALTYVVGGAGLATGDTLSGALATTATTTSNVGTYGITQGTLAASSNYTVTAFTGANLTVTPRTLTVVYTANGASRVYGDANPALSGTTTSTGLVNGDTLSGTASWTTTAGATTGVGNYGITGSGLSASSNYALTSTQDAGNATALSITPRTLTVVYTANGASRVYGDANPALSGTTTSTGLVNGDTLSGTASWTTTAGATTGVGNYGITGSGLSASSNYALTSTQALSNATALAITKRSLIITANALSRIFGAANPPLTYAVGGAGLVNGDALSGALATTATATSNVGTYGITQGTLSASADYSVTYNGANLTVTGAPSGQTTSQVVGGTGEGTQVVEIGGTTSNGAGTGLTGLSSGINTNTDAAPTLNSVSLYVNYDGTAKEVGTDMTTGCAKDETRINGTCVVSK